jgi:hypothetical protein
MLDVGGVAINGDGLWKQERRQAARRKTRFVEPSVEQGTRNKEQLNKEQGTGPGADPGRGRGLTKH